MDLGLLYHGRLAGLPLGSRGPTAESDSPATTVEVLLKQ